MSGPASTRGRQLFKLHLAVSDMASRCAISSHSAGLWYLADDVQYRRADRAARRQDKAFRRLLAALVAVAESGPEAGDRP